MDTLPRGFSRPMNEFKLHPKSTSSCSTQSNLINGFKINPLNFSDPLVLSTNSQSSSGESDPDSTSSFSEENDHSNAILKYINDMLMGEDLTKQGCMYQECMALQATEKSFYNLLNQNHIKDFKDYPDGNFTSGSNLSVESKWNRGDVEFGDFQLSSDETLFPHLGNDFGSNVFSSSDGSDDLVDQLVDSPVSTLLVHEEPPLIFMNNGYDTEKITHRNSVNSSRGRKFHEVDDHDLEEFERSNKHSANYTEFTEQLDMFDEVLLCNGGHEDKLALCKANEPSQTRGIQKLQKNGVQSKGTKSVKKNEKKVEMVDLRGLLTQCAQAVASNEQRTATDLLNQIRQHSSPFGDGIQRLAHYFAQGLEARLLGCRTQYTALHASKTSAAEILKAYQVYLTSCPFKKMSNVFANKSILKIAEKATRIHIIDFGILYGFQWPCFIQGLSTRKGGPPKLRITGIELPKPGFRPAERVEETGQRLRKYCERFNVPFEYNAIAQKWETIKLEDLKIDRNELVIVNCLYRLENLPDDTTVTSSPRDTVLNLIRRIKPDLFIHGVVNGTYNAPFFLTRFRETLYHFSALFDMFEATILHENEERLMFEKEIFGRDAINIIACEGLERVDRPETHKQWQARNLRVGFRQVPLDKDIFAHVRSKVKLDYHKEFVVDENGGWMLQGWKGRILYGLSCWKPAF